MTLSNEVDQRVKAAELFEEAFVHLSNNKAAWQDIIRLARDQNSSVRRHAAYTLQSIFSYVADKDQVWCDLIDLAKNQDKKFRSRVAFILKSVFPQVSDKDQAWKVLIELAKDEDSDVRHEISESLISAFPLIKDKGGAWFDLRKLAYYHDKEVRWIAVRFMGLAFADAPDKYQSWKDLHEVAHDSNWEVRLGAIESIALAFPHIPDKAEAWEVLCKLSKDQNNDVQLSATESLGHIFVYHPDKRQAFFDLHQLTLDKNSRIRQASAENLDYVFTNLPDKNSAWEDLHRLAQDHDSYVRWSAAKTIGSAFSSIPDRNEARQDLVELAKDDTSEVRMYAYHSLGRVSVFKATEAENRDYLLSELKTAISYFEKSSHEKAYHNPAKYCLPFYRSYLAVTFHGAKDDEVNKYLAEAKKAVGSSESKAELIEAVDNLAKALQKSQELKDKPLEAVINDLNAYRWYCEKAAEHIMAAEEGAPGAVKLMRKCNPLLEEKIQSTIAEIQKKAEQICQITRGSGTEYESHGAEIHRAAKDLSTVDLVSVQNSSSRIVVQLREFCKLLPENERSSVCDVVKEIGYAAEFPEKLHLIEIALLRLNPILKGHKSTLADIVILTVLPEEYNAVSNQLSRLRHPSNMGSSPNLYAWQLGDVYCPKFKGTYRVVVGMIGRAGNNQSALATREAIELWKPPYIFFCGIAGGLLGPKKGDDDMKKGDVIIADVIHGYEYGKIDKNFAPRDNWTNRTDQGLLTGANAYALQNGWRERIRVMPPNECMPNVIRGEVASGDKIIDDSTNVFFSQVLKRWPKVKAVEMEGAGISSAIEQAHSLHIPIGFMVIRGISDLPRHKGKGRGTGERDSWKPYASETAAAFIVGWIADGLPIQPHDRE